MHLIKTLNLGGAETNLLNLVSAVDRSRFELHVAYSFGGEIEDGFRRSGVTLFKYDDQDNKVKSLASAAIVWKLVRYIRQNKIQVIHTHNFSAHLWGCAAAKTSGARLLEHVHDFRYLPEAEFKKRRGSNMQYRFARYLKGVSDAVVVLTRQNAAFLRENGYYPSSKIREIPNGIPISLSESDTVLRRSEARQKWGIPSDAAVVLTSARLAPEKNIDLLLRIAPRVLAKCPTAHFLVCGDGPLFAELNTRASDPDLGGHLHVVGFQSDMRDALAASDIYLLPSFLELHSIGILEAMSMRLPVVISRDVGCHDEFVHDWKNGVLLDPFRDEGWEETLVELLLNPGLRRELGENAYRTCAGRFDIRNTAEKIGETHVELAGR